MIRDRIVRVLAIVVVWTVAGFLMAIYDDLVVRTLGLGDGRYTLGRAIAVKTAGTAVGALVAAVLVVFVFKTRLRGRPFSVAVVLQGLAFASIAVAVGQVFSNFATVTRDLDPAAAEAVLRPALMKGVLFALVLGGLTSFALEVQDRVGRGAFLAFLLGRYHRARTERRCFLFLDLAGSTALAERLGHVRYFELLNEFFADATDALLETRGEVYQYVGDEIIVSWPESVGLRRANCVRCVHLFEDRVASRADRYRERYGAVPDFRAALHAGDVTAGEVGVLKREQVFSGDTLNTASRIQERCKALDRRLLVSGDLADRLPAGVPFRLEPMEEIELRGKAGSTRILAVERGT